MDLAPTPEKSCPNEAWACWDKDLGTWVWSEKPVPRKYAWPQFKFIRANIGADNELL